MTADKPKGRRGRKPVKPPVIDLAAKEVETARPAPAAKAEAKTQKPPAAKPAQAKSAAAKSDDSKAASARSVRANAGSGPDAAKAEPAREASPKPEARPEAVAASASEADTSPPPSGTGTRPVGGIVGYLCAGAVGAIVALGASYFAGFAQDDSPVAAAPPAELIARLDALEATQADAAARIDALSEVATGEPGGAAEAVRDAVTQALGPLRGELEEARQAIAALEAGRADDGGALQQVQADAAALREELSAIAASGIDGGSPDALAGIETRIDALQGEVAALRDAAAPDIEAVATRVAEETAGAVALDAARQASEAALADVDARLLALDAEIASLKAEFAQAGGSGGADARVAQALALAALRDALAGGRDFSAEFETLRALLPDNRGLLALETSTGGIPTAATLAERFDTILPELLAAARQSGDAGVMARLIDNARSIVTVRQVGVVAGDTPEALVARIEASLAAGDLAAAAADWQRLPEPARAAAADWGDALTARVAAETVVAELGSELIGGIDGAEEPAQ